MNGSAAAARKPPRPTSCAVRRARRSRRARSDRATIATSTIIPRFRIALNMKALVTGATGKVGNGLARALHDRGDEVRALVRDPARAAALLPAGVALARGDVTVPDSLRAAVDGCEVVFNA